MANLSNTKLNIIVATCNSRGIGIRGTLPWRIRGDLKYFKQITTDTEHKGKQNVVIMGRKTWQSIPSAFRPLPNRINLVLSRSLQLSDLPPGVLLADSFDEALALCSRSPLADTVDKLFVIGGSTVYQTAIQSSHCQRLYITRVLADFECDTYLPPFDENVYVLTSDKESHTEVHTENNIQYRFEVYEKDSMTDVAICKFNICAAIDQKRGFGFCNQLPWPKLTKDYNHYIRLTSQPKDPNKKCVNIKGRLTYLSSGRLEMSNSNVICIVVSTTLTECPPSVRYIARDLPSALRIASRLVEGAEAESIWVMGGQRIYEEAVESADRVYLTRVDAQFSADRFFPAFESAYDLIKDDEIDCAVQEDNGIQYTFEVYERKLAKH